MDASQNKSDEPVEITGSLSNTTHHVAELEFEKNNNEGVPLTSAFASLPRLAAIRKFWRLYLSGLGVAISGM